MNNEEIVRKFVESKSVDFNAIGKLVSTLAPQLAVSKTDLRMVLVGRPFIIACMMPALEAMQLVGDLHKAELGARALKGQG